MIVVTAHAPGQPINAATQPTAANSSNELARLADAIDRMHGHQIAHGSLCDDDIRIEGTNIWLHGAGLAFRMSSPASASGGLSPRQADLVYFDSLCRRRLEPKDEAGRTADSLKPFAACGPSAAAILNDWRTRCEAAGSAPPADQTRRFDRPPPSRAAAQPVYEVFSEQKTLAAWHQRRFLRLALTVLLAITIIAVPTFVVVSPEYLYRRAVATARRWLGLNRRPRRPAHVDRTNVVERAFTTAWRQAQSLTKSLESPSIHWLNENLTAVLSAEPFRASMNRLRLRCADAGAWLRSLSPGRNSGEWRRRLDHVFLALSGPDNIAAVRRRLDAPDADSRLEACRALVRLKQPASVAAIESLFEQAGSPRMENALLLLLLRHYSYADSRTFLRRVLLDPHGRPRPRLFTIAVDAPGQTTSALIEEMIPALVDGHEFESPIAIVASLVCLQRVRPSSPDQLVDALHVGPRRRRQIRTIVAEQLLSGPGVRMRCGPYEIADPWFAAGLRWNEAKATEFMTAIHSAATARVEPMSTVRAQSLILTLANVESPSERDRLASKLTDVLTRQMTKPTLAADYTAVLLLVLAATGSSVSAQFQEEFVATRGSELPLEYWHAWLEGTALSGRFDGDLLDAALGQSNRSVANLSRQFKALQAGDLAAFRRTAVSAATAERGDTATDAIDQRLSLESLPLALRYGALRRQVDSPTLPVAALLEMMASETSVVAQHAAAIAVLKTARPDDKPAIRELLYRRVLFSAAERTLKLADQL
jgi:hypothetical protein